MINLSSFIAFHARRTPDRCALKYRGEDVSYAAFDARIRMVGGWLASRGIGAGRRRRGADEEQHGVSRTRLRGEPHRRGVSADQLPAVRPTKSATSSSNSGARILIADEELAGIAAGGAPVVLLDEAAQADATRLAPDAAPAADACPAAARPDAADVHLRHHRPAQGRDADLREHLLEIGGPDAGAGP